jgi:hypothetical protein
MNAVETDLRQTDTLIGQYMQGSSLTTILTAILYDIASSTTTQTLGSVTGITYTFVNSVIDTIVDTIIEGLGLYYPDWGKSEACINDGNQPDYMTNFPSQWMYQDIESCCQRYYSYDLIGCLSSEPSYIDPTENLFYPDWIGKTNTCIRDGQAPAYMKKSYTLWMYTSLEDCCSRYYSWKDDYNYCITAGGGSIPVTQTPAAEGWYVNYVALSCVKSCEGPSPCGGVGHDWDVKYESKEICCANRLWWLGDSCNSN